jgi:glycerophosphoryl diester phosphodiesterase
MKSYSLYWNFAVLITISVITLEAMPAKDNPVKIIAHRGAWKQNNLPQNSIASLKMSVKLNLAGSEMDIQMTADDSLVINHDKNFNKLNVEKTEYKELVKFRLSNGEKLPTLREYLIAGSENNNSTRLICEIKPSGINKERGVKMAEKVVRLVRELNVQHLVSYISFDYNILKKITELDPGADTQYLNGDKNPDLLKSDGIRGADYNISVFRKNPQWIEEAKRAGIVLNAWTVNKPEDMDWLIGLGFDYITTDEPELLRERLEKVIKQPDKLPE